MSNREEGYVGTHIRNGVATIEFYHPLSNSLPAKLLSLLEFQILDAGRESSVHCIVIKSAGERAFCGGASFDELMSIDDEEQGKQFFSGFANVINAIRTCGKIVICRIQGKAVGGAVGIAAAADISLATKFSAIRLSELAVGIGPFVIGPAVERKVGTAAFTYLSLTPDEWQSPDWAADKGLFSRVFEDAATMDDYLEELLDKFASYNPEALNKMKTVFWQGTDHWNSLLAERAEISGQLVLSEFTRSAIQAFKKK